MKNLTLSKAYQLLEPGPVVMLTTARGGRANVMTLSWHMMMEFEPPLVACVVSNRSHSFAALRATKECVIAIPALELAPKVVQVGNCSGRTVDKFKRFSLTPVPAGLWPRLWWPSASQTSNAGWPILVSSTSTACSSWKCSRHGLTLPKRTRRPSTIMDTAGLLWMAR